MISSTLPVKGGLRRPPPYPPASVPDSVYSRSQLCPNRCVPARSAESWSIPGIRLQPSLTRTEWDRTGLGGTGWDTVNLPGNAQVVGSSPTSGSSSEAYFDHVPISDSASRHQIAPDAIAWPAA